MLVVRMCEYLWSMCVVSVSKFVVYVSLMVCMFYMCVNICSLSVSFKYQHSVMLQLFIITQRHGLSMLMV